MSLQGTFNTAVQALNAQSQQLSNISTNIANVNTTGFKAQATHFAMLLNRTDKLEKSFFSVDTVDFRQVDRQGNIATTNRTFDVAINGRGLFVTNTQVDGTGEWQYTRDGAFFGKAVDLRTDSDNNGQNDQGTFLTTASGAYVYGWAADAEGAIAEDNNRGSLSPILFNNNSVFPASRTANIRLQANLSASAASGQNVGLPFVDQNGASRTLTLGFTKSLGSDAWTIDMSSVDENLSPVAVSFTPATLTFNGIGQIAEPADGFFYATIRDRAGDHTVTIDLTKLSQYGDSGRFTVENIEQDGFLEGRLEKTYFTSQGILVGSYSNGEVRNLYQLSIATFAAENNLEARNGNVFLESQGSGEADLTSINSGLDRTQIVTGALESSNVDLTDQFSKMIVTQRAYSSAATVLRTADEMSQAARDLKR